MTMADLRARYRDVAFTTATPFTDDGASVRYDALAENIATLYDAGARQFVPCGNTGEYYALTDDERVRIVETHVDATGREATVTAGAAGSLPEVRSLLESYEAVGADAVMVMHPDHTYVHEAGLVEYYNAICDMTDLGVVIYKRGPDVSRDVLTEVCPRDNVVAVKFAVNDIKEFSQSVADVPGDVTWVNGIAERYAIAFAAEGATGYTTGVGNFLPDVTLSLFEALEAAEWERAREMQHRLRPFEDLREEPGQNNRVAAANNVPVVKYGMDLAGYEGGPVRPPLAPLSEQDSARVEEYYATV